MPVEHLLTIGAFARYCGLSRSALRFYDECGLVRPVAVDDSTGYRYYDAGQVPDAVLVRRLRTAELPVAEVRRFLEAEADERKVILAAHSAKIEERTGALRRAVEELRAELEGPGQDHGARGCAISPEALSAGLGQVLFAADREGRRPELSGIWVEARQGSLRLVATDSYRLAVRDLVIEDEGGERGVRGFVPLRQAEELAGMLTGACTAALRQGPHGAVEVVIDDTSVTIGRPDEDFPDYEAVPTGNPVGHKAVTERSALTEALIGLACATASIDFMPGTLVVRSAEEEVSIEASWDGPPYPLCSTPASSPRLSVSWSAPTSWSRLAAHYCRSRCAPPTPAP